MFLGLECRERLDKLGFFSLERRRLKDVPIEVYTVMKGMDKVNAHGVFPPK